MRRVYGGIRGLSPLDILREMAVVINIQGHEIQHGNRDEIQIEGGFRFTIEPAGAQPRVR